MNPVQVLVEKIKDEFRVVIESYLEQYGPTTIIGYTSLPSSEIDHIKSILLSILLHKFEVVSYRPGSFVNAILTNNLTETFGRADNTNQKAIKFYVMALYNLGYSNFNKALIKMLNDLRYCLCTTPSIEPKNDYCSTCQKKINPYK